MKQILSFIIFFTIPALLAAQPVIEWQFSYGGTLSDGMFGLNGGREHIQPTSDGGFVIASTSYSNDGDVSGHHGSTATSDFWVFKIDSLGGIEWQNSFGGSEDEKVNGIQNTSDGGYILIGETNSTDGDVTGYHVGPDAFKTDAWVVKLDSLGNLEWEQAYGGAGGEAGRGITETHDGGYVFVGYADSTDGDVSGLHALSDVWLVKIDNAGSLLWQHCLGGSSFENGRNVRLTNDNGFIIAAMTSSSDGDAIGNTDTTIFGGTWVIKTDSLGNIEWQDTYGGSWFEFGQDVWNLPNGNFLFGAHTSSTDGDVTAPHNGGADYWVLNLDDTGNVIWNKCYGGSDSESLHSLRLTNDGGFLAMGHSTSSDGDVSVNKGSNDYWLIRADSSGNLLWEVSMGGSGREYGKTVIQTNNGGYLVVGESDSNDGDVSGHHGPTTTADVWLVKLSPVSTGLNVPDGNIASFSIAPNPVASNAVMNFELTRSDHIQISLFDLSGRLVQTITDRKMNAGVHSFDLDTEALQLENGMYLVRVAGSNSVMTTKLIKN
jgi:hypothetical protein